MEGLLKVIKDFPDRKIVVIGDVMLDTYVHGTAMRLSPEAPVPDIKVDYETSFPGGAANVASNIVSLGGRVSLFGFAGVDAAGEILSRLLKEKGIDFFTCYCPKTTQKRRYIAQNQQIVRISDEDTSQKLLVHSLLKKEMQEANLIVISDYAKGAISAEFVNPLKSFGKRILVDPKPQNADFYHGVDILKMNKSEALAMSDKSNFSEAGRYLLDKFDSNGVIITLGSEGVALFKKSSQSKIEFPASARNVTDITGAGDTFLAALGLSLASGARLEDAVLLANYASGIAVSRKGTYSVGLKELEEEVRKLR